jgi:hypothetical protein
MALQAEFTLGSSLLPCPGADGLNSDSTSKIIQSSVEMLP